jgi:sugar lactone lactonase YvrE
METLKPSVLLDGLVFPEGPRWHDGKLWFSDIHGFKVMAVDPDGRSEVIASVPQRPSGLGFLPDDRLLVVSVLDGLVLRLDSDSLETHADLNVLDGVLPNDMIVDERGRAYVGDVAFEISAGPPQPGNVILVTSDGTARIVAEGLNYPNGMVIAPAGDTLIVAETMGRRLTAFDIAADGSLSGRRTFADLATGAIGGAHPDGICLDAAGAVWVASPPTSEFVRVKEGGEVTHRIPVPTRWAVACTLGGDDRRTLFLCTAETTLQDLGRGKSVGWIETVRVEVPGAGLP